MKTIDQILKIKAVVLYILKQLPQGVDYIHLFKIMYFAQQEHLVTYGLPLVDDTFVARKHGPVATLTYKVLHCVEGKDVIKTSDLNDFTQCLSIRMEDNHQIVTAKPESVCDMDELSGSNQKILDKWIKKCKDVEAFDLADMSHDKAWLKAKKQAEKTGEDTKIPLVDIAQAAGATKEMLGVIRERQLNQYSLQWT
jgi:uncharacterized phage-associated protein